MKTAAVALSALAVLAGLASASPVQRQAPYTFTLIAIHSGDDAIQNEPINANHQLFWVGRPTTSDCPAASLPPGVCAPYTAAENTTVLLISGGSVSTSHAVPGEQSVYIQGANSTLPGALAYNSPHAVPPAGSITEGFSIDPSSNNLVSSVGDFFACPAMGAYYITTSQADSDFCVDINIFTFAYDGSTPAVWEYSS
jgi:hypothetical protein